MIRKAIRVAIVDDHPVVIDGYRFRLAHAPDIEVVAEGGSGEELERILARQAVDVLILDINLPTSRLNNNPFPLLHRLPRLIQTYPDLTILVITMHAERALANAVMGAGVSGYILKDDRASIQHLAGIIRNLADGEIHVSEYVMQQLMRRRTGELTELLSSRQMEALSLCAAYPDDTSALLAKKMNIAHSTLRNLLSEAYMRLGVRSRDAAVEKARRMGLITPDFNPPVYP